MLVLSNPNGQTIAPNAAATFTTELLKTGNGCSCGDRGAYRVPAINSGGLWMLEFHGNIASISANTAVNLALAVDGVILPETAMTVRSTAANDYYNVGTATRVKITGRKCKGAVVTVVNTGTGTVAMAANPSLTFHRVG